MTKKNSQVVIVYLDPYITDKLDEVIEHSSNNPRGNLISSALSFLVFQGDDVVKKHIDKANKLIEKSSQIDSRKKFGSIRVGKNRINLILKPSLAEHFKDYDKKVFVLAALIFVKVIKN
ncbi:hypothetical protein [Staphylococcus equorum]|uniref:hypothetical protein n=1 Tax=Staphylococcus equorum TaxID=246432 RepID=UPI001867FBA8|nr:hypothetical protein [Staphylococcus equorum]